MTRKTLQEKSAVKLEADLAKYDEKITTLESELAVLKASRAALAQLRAELLGDWH